MLDNQSSPSKGLEQTGGDLSDKLLRKDQLLKESLAFIEKQERLIKEGNKIIDMMPELIARNNNCLEQLTTTQQALDSANEQLQSYRDDRVCLENTLERSKKQLDSAAGALKQIANFNASIFIYHIKAIAKEVLVSIGKCSHLNVIKDIAYKDGTFKDHCADCNEVLASIKE